MESNRQIKTLNEEETIHALKRKSSHSKHSKQQQAPTRKKFEQKFSCGKCGTQHEK